MWKLEDKYKECCHNDACESFDTCIDCWDEWEENHPPMTNADRIRAMSDEELSVFLWSFDVVDVAMEEDGTALLRPKLTKWLQQPVKEDAQWS